ncbi:MAG: hypothetical protein R3E96_05610 [Planctomycetota bacterium]
MQVHAPGQNVYVRGLSGTGRLELVRRIVGQINPSAPSPRTAATSSAEQPDRPRLLSLQRGKDRAFARRVEQLSQYIQKELVPALSSDEIRARAKALEGRTA